VISAFQVLPQYATAFNFYARANQPGTHALRSTPLQEQIRALKSDGWFVIVVPHWGNNYCRRDERVWLMGRHIMARTAADLVIGHSAHLMAEIQQFGGRWVIFSLGNFIFNADSRYAEFDMAPYSLIAQLVVRLAGGAVTTDLVLYPILSDNEPTNFQPRFVTRSEFDRLHNWYRLGAFDPDAFDRNVSPVENGGRFGLRLAMT
jgi:UDP-N-acetylmuramoyl-tripeptide--D-alanyl-D-alanine ligase/cyanophycin synthetase/poly-gamma-glutamate synthesis protein (capsule biosynthesis protein)